MILTSNALPGFYPAVYHQDVSLKVEALGPAPETTPAGTLAHTIQCRLCAKPIWVVQDKANKGIFRQLNSLIYKIEYILIYFW